MKRSMMQSQKVVKDSDEYIPGVEGELNHSSEVDTNEMRTRSVNLSSGSNKVSAMRGRSPTKMKETLEG
ncbi:hypothetical protein SOVF_063270 [Spinacia oleracea]|nr:hypothetical protein SOVF_063270 [Spinacia oleracea]